jgi:hypothetical protein
LLSLSDIQEKMTSEECEICGRELADYNKTGYCCECRAKGYDGVGKVYHVGEGKLGLGQEQERRYFRKYDKDGYQALPAEWRRRGINVWKSGRKWRYSFGATEEEIETAKFTAQLFNDLCKLVPTDLFAKRWDEVLADYGLDFLLDVAAKWGYSAEVERWRSSVRIGSGLNETRRMTGVELARAMRAYLQQNPELPTKVKRCRAMLATKLKILSE